LLGYGVVDLGREGLGCGSRMGVWRREIVVFGYQDLYLTEGLDAEIINYLTSHHITSQRVQQGSPSVPQFRDRNLPRRSTPRQNVPPSSLALAGTCILPGGISDPRCRNARCYPRRTSAPIVVFTRFWERSDPIPRSIPSRALQRPLA